MRTLFLILVSGLLGVTGQVVLKRALMSIGPLPLGLDTVAAVVWQLASKQQIVLGLAVYLSGTFFWLVALSRVDLSYAYPLASVNYIFVLGGSWVLLGEQPTPQRMLGVLAICIGVGLLSRSRAATVRAARQLRVRARAVIGGTQP